VLNRPQSLSDISSELGFAEQVHFTRFFRNHSGVSARENSARYPVSPLDTAAQRKT
jgi:AraC-like DNA-binding protein